MSAETASQVERSASEPPIVDGFDRDKLRECLAARGLLIASDAIVGVGASGARVDFDDSTSLWVLPRWIATARVAVEGQTGEPS